MSAAASSTEVRVVDMPALRFAVVRSRVAPTGMQAAQRAARAALAAAGLAAPRRATLWRRADGLFDYAPGVEVSGDVSPSEPVSVIDLPAGRAAHLAFEGGYERLGAAWGRLFAACPALGVTPAGWNWEIYAAEGEPDAADLYAAVT